MIETRSSSWSSGSSDVGALLDRRRQLDQEIQRHRAEVTILFSDIVGYTRYVQQHGDVEGRVLQQRHEGHFQLRNELLGGIVVKTIGDAVMIRFQDASAAVETACQVLRDLTESNLDLPSRDQLHIRIGIASGRAIIEEQDVNGDVVNMASRLCKMAEVDGIMVSDSTVHRLDGYLAGLCIPQTDRIVRGAETASPLVYRVHWDTRTPAQPVASRTDVLVLEIGLEGNKITQSLYIDGMRTETVNHYENLPWQAEIIDAACVQITQAFKRANKVLGKSSLAALKSAGGTLYDVLLTANVKKDLQKSEKEHLVIRIQDSLVSIPWELLYDGKEFLCMRFSMGRRVNSRQKTKEGKPKWSLRPTITILSDPCGNLPAASQEGRDLVGRLNVSERFRVAMRNGADLEYARKSLRESQIVHFCGHADYVPEQPEESGWTFSNGKLKGSDVHQMSESHDSLPLVVFSNACQSGRGEEWAAQAQDEIYGLASAFLHSGVQHYIGTFWDVLDAQSREFAIHFYEYIMQGEKIGSAMQKARSDLRDMAGEENLVWASYMLYGNPAESVFGVPKVEEKKGTDKEEKQLRHTMEPEPVQPPVVGPSESGEKIPKWLLIICIIVVIAGLSMIWWSTQEQTKPSPPVAPPPPSDTLRYLQYLSTTMESEDYLENRKAIDAWTSRPLTIALLPFDLGGSANEGSIQTGEIYNLLDERLRSIPGVELVEREKIDEVLKELNIGSSQMANSGLEARLGELLFARFLAFGKVAQEDGQSFFSLRLVECETTKVIARAYRAGDGNTATYAEEVAQEVESKLIESIPLQGKVLQSDEDRVYLNIGLREGVQEKQQFVAITEKDMGKGNLLEEKIAEMEIIQVGSTASVARVLSSSKSIAEKTKVRSVFYPKSD